MGKLSAAAQGGCGSWTCSSAAAHLSLLGHNCDAKQIIPIGRVHLSFVSRLTALSQFLVQIQQASTVEQHLSFQYRLYFFMNEVYFSQSAAWLGRRCFCLQKHFDIRKEQLG